MSDFNFYLNRVGVRGPKGEQGEQGFSPIITVATNTLSEYILQIQTQNNTFLTANLREHKDDLGGTYIRYDRETGVMYAGEADTATTQNLGEVRFATATELERNDGSTVVTPADVNTLINAKGYDAAIEAVDNKADANADNIATNTGNISILQGQMSGVLGNYVTTNTSQTISGMKTFSNGLRCLTLRDTSGTPYISFNPSAQNRYLLISDNTNFEQDVRVVGNLTTFRDNESHIVIDSGNISDYIGNGTITFTQGGVTKGTITTNQSGDTTIALDAGGGSSYTAGNGIDITNDEISIDTNVVATKSDIPDVSNMVTTDTAQTITGRKTFDSIIANTAITAPSVNSNQYYANTGTSISFDIGNRRVLFANTNSAVRKIYLGNTTNFDNIVDNSINGIIDKNGNVYLTSSNISSDATITNLMSRISALETKITALETNINGGNA